MVTDKTRREAFITQNLGLVHACAGRFRGRGMEYDDLYSAGCVGLIKAYDNFDESRGVCFSTYAVPVILGEIKKLFRDGGYGQGEPFPEGTGNAGASCTGAYYEAVRRRAYLAAAG